MSNEIISHPEMCRREDTSLQRGMNFRVHNKHSVILMSRRPNAPYQDILQENGTVLIYEGHDIPKYRNISDPKSLDQPEYLPSGRLTDNGKFHKAAQDYKNGQKGADLVRVYEKIKSGIWIYNGYFQLVDSWLEHDGKRNVFKFKLVAIEDEPDESIAFEEIDQHHERRRLIPSHIKQEVWKRDKGKCVECGAEDELHFDHILPFSKGGTSLKAENVQLLCARHNLQKRDKIQ